MTNEVYECQHCRKTISVSTTKDHTPTCCGKPMKKMQLDICLQPAHAEHVRPMDKEDACDDFRKGK